MLDGSNEQPLSILSVSIEHPLEVKGKSKTSQRQVKDKTKKIANSVLWFGDDFDASVFG